MRNYSLLSVLSVFLLSACQEGNLDLLEQEIAVGALDITSIEVSAPAALDDRMPLGDKLQFVATGTKKNGEEIDVSNLVSWGVSDTGVATIDENGLLTSVTAAAVTTSASISTISDTKDITIVDATVGEIEITNINIVDPLPSIPICSEVQLKAIGTYDLGGSFEFRWDVTDDAVWEIVVDNIGSFPENGLLQVADNVPLPAETQVKATVNGVASGETSITIDSNLTGITITPPSPSVTIGSKIPLIATANRTNGVDNVITDMSLWRPKAPDRGFITVGPTGEVTGVSKGTAIVEAMCGNLLAEVSVSVLESDKLERIVITNKDESNVFLSIKIGEEENIIVNGYYANSENPKDITGSVTWKEPLNYGDGKNIISLERDNSNDAIGRVKGLAVGIAGVKVTFIVGGQTLSDDILIKVE